MNTNPASQSSSPAVGAVWLRGLNLKRRLESFLKEKGVSYSSEEVNNIFSTAHTLTIKIKTHKGGECEIEEKYIAVTNTRAKTMGPTQPDYFVHVYQTNTGAAPISPWGAYRSKAQGRDVSGTGYGKNAGLGTSGNQVVKTTTLQDRDETPSTNLVSHETIPQLSSVAVSADGTDEDSKAGENVQE